MNLTLRSCNQMVYYMDLEMDIHLNLLLISFYGIQYLLRLILEIGLVHGSRAGRTDGDAAEAASTGSAAVGPFS